MLKILIINFLLVVIVIIVHYESLLRLSLYLPTLKIKYRFRVAIGLAGALTAHVIEVWIFGIAYYFLVQQGNFGYIKTEMDLSLMNCVYFSFVTYTSLGYGDMIPVGLIQFTAGIQALTGLVLIAMTASFMYVQIEKFWSEKSIKK